MTSAGVAWFCQVAGYRPDQRIRVFCGVSFLEQVFKQRTIVIDLARCFNTGCFTSPVVDIDGDVATELCRDLVIRIALKKPLEICLVVDICSAKPDHGSSLFP